MPEIPQRTAEENEKQQNTAFKGARLSLSEKEKRSRLPSASIENRLKIKKGMRLAGRRER